MFECVDCLHDFDKEDFSQKQGLCQRCILQRENVRLGEVFKKAHRVRMRKLEEAQRKAQHEEAKRFLSQQYARS